MYKIKCIRHFNNNERHKTIKSKITELKINYTYFEIIYS